MRNTTRPRQPSSQTRVRVRPGPFETPCPHRTIGAQGEDPGCGFFRRRDLLRRSMSGFSRLPLPGSVATVVVIKERERQPMDAAHSLLLSPQSPRPALLSPICEDVEMQRRLNTSTLNTLNKPPDSAEVFKDVRSVCLSASDSPRPPLGTEPHHNRRSRHTRGQHRHSGPLYVAGDPR